MSASPKRGLDRWKLSVLARSGIPGIVTLAVMLLTTMALLAVVIRLITGDSFASVLGPLVGGFVAVAAFLRTMYRGAPETRKPKTQRDRYQASEDPELPNPAFDA